MLDAKIEINSVLAFSEQNYGHSTHDLSSVSEPCRLTNCALLMGDINIFPCDH